MKLAQHSGTFFSGLLALAVACLYGCAVGDRPTSENPVLRTETELARNDYEKGMVTVPCTSFEQSIVQVCFTSLEAQGHRPIDVLHDRFMRAREPMGVDYSGEADLEAFCTKGVLRSCELETVLLARGYRRDPDVLFQLMLLMSHSASIFLSRVPESEHPYPENYRRVST